MSTDPRSLVPEYVLGILPAEDRAEFERALSGSADLQQEIRLASLAAFTLPDSLGAVAAPRGRARLLETLAGPDRFRAFFAVLRRWFDLTEETLRAVLARVDAATGWLDAPFPGVRYLDFHGGPAAMAKEAGLVRLTPGARFPPHRHLGTERSMVLEGTLLLDGRRRHAGDVVKTPAGATHEFQAGPGRDLVLIVAHDGITFSP